MKEFRPYDAKDNDINQMIKDVVLGYCKRHNEEVEELQIYEQSVIAKTTSGREIIGNITYGMVKKDYIYLKEEIAGKQKRIKKSEW